MLWRSFVSAGYCCNFSTCLSASSNSSITVRTAYNLLNEKTALSQLQIERLEVQISALKQSGMEREQEIDLKQAELCCVIDEKARLRNCLFMETSIFKHIEN